jgi:hypothetical protein
MILTPILLKLEHPQGLDTDDDADTAETNQEHYAPNSTSLSGGIIRHSLISVS